MSSAAPDQGSNPAQWEGIDPRVQWAFDLYDMQGAETISIVDNYLGPGVMGAAGAGFNIVNNLLQRKPVKAGIQWTILGGLIGAWVGVLGRDYNAERRQKRIQTTLHYVMLHPDRFPQPERKKYGDKNVLYDWHPVR